MEIVGIQLDTVWEDKQANFEKVQSLLAENRPSPKSLVILPEMFATGFSMNSAAIAEERGGRTEQFLKELAQSNQVHVIGGVACQTSDGKATNQAVVFNDAGQEIARYSKIHPFSPAHEGEHYQPGTEILTFPCEGITVGLFICYDLRFPEVFRTAVQRGVKLFVVIACWPAVRAGHWRALLVARAIENQAYVFGVNRCGVDPHLEYSGGSLFVDPRGDILVDGGSTEKVLSSTLDPRLVAEYRQAFPYLQDIRPEYRLS